MDCLPPPQTPHPRPKRALALRSVGGVVTPLPDGEVVLGREGSLGLGITSPLVSRQQALLVRDSAGGLRLVSRGRVNPTLLVRDGGAVLRLAQGESVEVSPGDAIVLRGDRVLREGAGSLVSDDEAFTLVDEEAPDMDLAAALCEIARLRAELDAARRAPATPAAAEPTDAEAAPAAAPSPMEEEVERPMEPSAAPSPTEEAERPLDSQGTVEAAAAQSPMEEEIERPMDSQGTVAAAPAAAEARLAVDAVDALRLTKGLEIASLTYTEDGKRLAVRWRGGGATCVEVVGRAWAIRDVGATSDEARVARALGLAGALSKASAAPRAGVDAAVAAFLDAGSPRAPEAAEEEDDDDSVGDFDDDPCATSALVAEELESETEDSPYEASGDEEGGDDQRSSAAPKAETRGAKFVKRLLVGAATKRASVSSVRWDGDSLSGVVSRGARQVIVTLEVRAAGDAVVLRASCRGTKGRASWGAGVGLADSVPALQLLRVAAKTPDDVARVQDVAADAAKLAPQAVADVLLHAVATAAAGTTSAYECLKEAISTAAPATASLLVDAAAVERLALPAAIASVVRTERQPSPAPPKKVVCFKLASPVFYDAARGVVFGRVVRKPGEIGVSYSSSTDVAFAAARDGEGLRLDLTRSWSEHEPEWDQPLMTPAALAFSELATEAVDVDALRTGLLALPDVRATAIDLAFSPATSGAGLDKALPRLLAEAASAGAVSPGAAYVRDLDAVVFDATVPNDDPAIAAQEERAATAVAAYVEKAEKAFTEAEQEAEYARENWVSGDNCGCEPEPYGRGECPCRDWDCYGDCGNEREISCNCAEEENPMPDAVEFVQERLEETVGMLLERAESLPENVREALLVGVAGGLVEAQGRYLPTKIVKKAGPPVKVGPGSWRLPRKITNQSDIEQALEEAIEGRLNELTDRAAELAKAGRPNLFAKLLPLRETVAFPADDLVEAMAAPESKPVLLAAVNAAAAKLAARLTRLRLTDDVEPVRSNIRELLARGWLDEWATVAGVCALDGAEKLSHCMDYVDFALEVAHHEAAPDDALPAVRKAAIAAVEAWLTRASPPPAGTLDRAAATLRAIAAEDAGAGAVAAAKRGLDAVAEAKLWDRWPTVARVALELDRGAETVAAATRGAAALLAHDVAAGAAAVRAGIADGWLPVDRCLAVEAFSSCAGPKAPSLRGALFDLALDEVTRRGAAASLRDSVLDAIVAQPLGGVLEGAPEAFVDRVAALRPDLAVALCLASLDGVLARKRAARVLIAHGSDDALLAFVQAEVARPQGATISFVVEAADVGITFTNESGSTYRYSSYGSSEKGLKVTAVTARDATAAGVCSGMRVVSVGGDDVAGLKTEDARAKLKAAPRPMELVLSWPTQSPSSLSSSFRHGFTRADAEFDKAARAHYERLQREYRKQVPDIRWLHAMLVASGRRCGEAACALTAAKYEADAGSWRRKLESEFSEVQCVTLAKSNCTRGHSRPDLVFGCRHGCALVCGTGVHAIGRLHALVCAGLPETTARPCLDALAKRTVGALYRNVQNKVQSPITSLTRATLPGFARFGTPSPLPEFEGLKMAPYAHPPPAAAAPARAPCPDDAAAWIAAELEASPFEEVAAARAREEAIDGEALRSMGEDELCDVLFQGRESRPRLAARKLALRLRAPGPPRRWPSAAALDRGLAAWGAAAPLLPELDGEVLASLDDDELDALLGVDDDALRAARNLCRRAVPGFDDALPPKPETLHEVVVVGSTGAGKSSLLNAFLGEAEVLPTSCTASCGRDDFRVIRGGGKQSSPSCFVGRACAPARRPSSSWPTGAPRPRRATARRSASTARRRRGPTAASSRWRRPSSGPRRWGPTRPGSTRRRDPRPRRPTATRRARPTTASSRSSARTRSVTRPPSTRASGARARARSAGAPTSSRPTRASARR